MPRRRVLAVVMVAASLALAACTPQELGEFFADEDLRSSDDPAVAASGYGAEAVEADRAAQGLVEQGLREKSRDKLEQAIERRPSDARYPLYLAALAYADGDRDTFSDAFLWSSRTYVRERSENSDQTDVELYSDWILVYLGAFDQTLAIERDRLPAEPERVERLESNFCDILSFYLDNFGPGSRDVLSVMFLGGAECEGVW